MQRLGRLAYSFQFRTAGQDKCCYWNNCATPGLPLLPSRIPIQELCAAYVSSTLCRSPIQAPILARTQHHTTALGRTASSVSASSSSSSRIRQQFAPAPARSLTAMPVCRTISQLGPAAARYRDQPYTSASEHVPSPAKPQSVSRPLPESAARQSGPDISLLNAVQQRQWDHASNAHLGNILVKPQSNRTAHWICTQCPEGLPHRWEARIDHVYESSKRPSCGCPYCSGRDVCAHNSLARKAPHLIKQWDTARNLESASDYTHASTHRAHWVCAHGHTWQYSIQQRVTYNSGCPDCATARRGWKAPTLTASSGRIMQIWDHAENAKAGLDPSRLTCGSNRRAHFRCPEGHQWMAVIDQVARKTRTIGCPYCSGRCKTKITK